jgi:hypothetical protein
MANIATSLLDFGADPEALRLLTDDGPDLLPYATLLAARRSGNATLDVVEAVYEWQGAPLIFLVDADSIQHLGQLHHIRRILAMRGDAPYLGVVAPGRLEVYRIALDSKSLQQSRVYVDNSDNARFTTISQLGNTRPKAEITRRDWISNVILKLLTSSITKLIHLNVSDEDAISLVGRALFTRFLADRNLLPNSLSRENTPASWFDTRDAAAQTSRWLDVTFNGDLLPLSEQVFDVLPKSAYAVLGDILRRAPNNQLFLGWEEKWDHLDFAHIPVGILSQAYELYLRNHLPDKQKREGSYYTPRPIADLMVRASFHALKRQGTSNKARILDPAAGAGVFLLVALRELVAERWRTDGERPNTQVLRSILYNQIVGFDINEAALRFAALGLYLMSIELDSDPRPVDKLRFKNLRGKVLYRLKTEDKDDEAVLGSLGPLVGDEHNGQYDLVIGNPPWSSGTKLRDWNVVRAKVALIAASRKIKNQSPPLPNEGLDLPFVWRAMEWAKPNGQIALALHARLLFQQGDGMVEARQALFEALDVTSIINGVELRQTKVWPEISAPFCILIATNRIPSAGAAFRLISPRIEEPLNGAGGMRIDALNSEMICSQQLFYNPEILKILFRGTKADLGIVERIRAQGHPTLEVFWRETFGVTERGHLLGSGNGYQKLRASSRVRKQGDGLPGVNARYLHGLPEVTAASFTNVSVETNALNIFQFDRIHDPRSIDLFTGPLILVHKSPPATTGRIGVAVSDHNVVFNETFYGYSPGTYSDGKSLVRYLALVLGSKLAIWFALVTSGEFGFEREVIEKATLDRIPLPNFSTFEPCRKIEVVTMFDQLHSGVLSWDDIDEWVAGLYGLGPRDLQVISDTLEYNLPFAENKRQAQRTPTDTETKQFCDTLMKELLPWCERFGSTLTVHESPHRKDSPWHGINLTTDNADAPDEILAEDWDGLLRAADVAAASEVVLRNGNNSLLIGRLSQRRYWNDTQARLLAQRIVWSHLDLLKGPSNI